MNSREFELCLVSGVSGFVGAAVALQFLRAGYRVRGTVRSEAKAEAWRARYPEWSESIEFAVVPDMAQPGAFDEAVRGATLVAHTASPFTFDFTDNERDVLRPAIRGTLEVLEAAHRAGTVRRVVVTSSFAAMENYGAGKAYEHVYTEEDWCQLTYEQAKEERADQLLVYVASKKLAEKAAWDFVDSHKPQFTLTTICPSFILGRAQPLGTLNDLHTSGKWLLNLIDHDNLDKAELGIPSMVDIDDVALAHVRAVERDAAQGQRFLLMGPEFSASSVADILRELYPEQQARFPLPSSAPPARHYGWDSSRAQDVLGIHFRSLADTIRDAADQVFELERKNM